MSFVVDGSVKLPVPPNRQQYIKVIVHRYCYFTSVVSTTQNDKSEPVVQFAPSFSLICYYYCPSDVWLSSICVVA